MSLLFLKLTAVLWGVILILHFLSGRWGDWVNSKQAQIVIRAIVALAIIFPVLSVVMI